MKPCRGSDALPVVAVPASGLLQDRIDVAGKRNWLCGKQPSALDKTEENGQQSFSKGQIGGHWVSYERGDVPVGKIVGRSPARGWEFLRQNHRDRPLSVGP